MEHARDGKESHVPGSKEPELRIATSCDPREEAFSVGGMVSCLAGFDREYHVAKVVDVRSSDSEHEWDVSRRRMYYVHYQGYDKRLDEWVDESRVEAWVTDPNTPHGSDRYVDLPSPTQGAGQTPCSAERRVTRHLKRRYQTINHIHQDTEDLPPHDQTLEKEHEERTKLKNVHVLQLGPYEMDTWYFSPYPGEYGACHKVYHCDACLKYFRKGTTLERHLGRCTRVSPPGPCIYRAPSPYLEPRQGKADDTDPEEVSISVYEVDGSVDKLYCQNLCLMAKLFLDHKTLYFDVDPFMFYVLTREDGDGKLQLVGYFSKEKASLNSYNLACILTLPAFQRKGYGKFLIALSYELSRREDKMGTPERPLSDLGLVSYKSYWARVLLEVMYHHRGDISIKEASQKTGIMVDDIVLTLQDLHLLRYWKGQQVISATPKIIEEHLRRCTGKRVGIDASLLKWEPRYVPSTRKQ